MNFNTNLRNLVDKFSTQITALIREEVVTGVADTFGVEIPAPKRSPGRPRKGGIVDALLLGPIKLDGLFRSPKEKTSKAPRKKAVKAVAAKQAVKAVATGKDSVKLVKAVAVGKDSVKLPIVEDGDRFFLSIPGKAKPRKFSRRRDAIRAAKILGYTAE